RVPVTLLRDLGAAGAAPGAPAALTDVMPDQFPYAAAASASSCRCVPAMSEGSFRKSCSAFHSPLPGVPPNACGAWSDMSKRKSSPASISALAVVRCTSLGQGELGTFLFGER